MLKILLIPSEEIKEVKPLKISEFEGEKIFYHKGEGDCITCSDFDTGTRLCATEYKSIQKAEEYSYNHLMAKKSLYKEVKNKLRKGDGGYYNLKIINK